MPTYKNLGRIQPFRSKSLVLNVGLEPQDKKELLNKLEASYMYSHLSKSPTSPLLERLLPQKDTPTPKPLKDVLSFKIKNLSMYVQSR